MTSAIDSDMLEGLPAAGSNIGGMMKGIAPGAGSLILTVGVAKGIGSIPGAIAKGITKRNSKKKRKSNQTQKKQHSKPLTKRKSLIPTYKYPKLPKMGPY